MIELESYMAPIPSFTETTGHSPEGPGKTVPSRRRSRNLSRIVDVIRRESVIHGSFLCWHISLIASIPLSK